VTRSTRQVRAGGDARRKKQLPTSALRQLTVTAFISNAHELAVLPSSKCEANAVGYRILYVD